MLAVQGTEASQSQIQASESVDRKNSVSASLVTSTTTNGAPGLSQSVAANDANLITSESAKISEQLNAATTDSGANFPGKKWLDNQADKVKHNIQNFVEDAFNGFLEKGTEMLLDGAVDALIGFQDEAEALLEGYDNLKGDFFEFVENGQNVIDMLPSWLEKPAQQVFDGFTQPIKDIYDTIDNSLGKKTLELIANTDKLDALLTEVTNGFDQFDNNPIHAIEAIVGPLHELPGKLTKEYAEENPYSEFAISQDPEATLNLVRDLLIPPLLSNNPDAIKEGDVTDDVFMGDVQFFDDVTAPRLEGQELPEGEQWFYINGVATTEEIGLANATQLSDMFGRSIDFMHNPTDGLVADVLESAIDKARTNESEPVQQMYGKVLEALETQDKVVITAHSQGSLITDAILEKLDEAYQNGTLSEENLSKLEIYTFANPATDMKSPVNEAGEQLVYMEHYVNENDTVASLGIIEDSQNDEAVIDKRFDGPVFVRDGGWGHFLGDFYLSEMDTAEEQAAWGDVSQSRLFSEYFDK